MAIFEYKFPELGEGIHEGEIVKLHVKAGDDVTDESLFMDVQNDKAIVEVASPVDGKVIEVKVKEGQICHVGQVIATIEVAGEGSPASEKPVEAAKAPESTPAPAVETPVEAPAAVKAPVAAETLEATTEKSTKGILATPSVRKLAREKGIALAEVTASGKNGRITREDVIAGPSGEAKAEEVPVQAVAAAVEPVSAVSKDSEPTAVKNTAVAQVTSAGQVERVPFKGIRKIVANAMVKSVYTIPHVTLMDEINVSALVAFRERMKPSAEKNGVKLTYLPFIIKALIAAARHYPIMNAELDEASSEIIYKKYYNIGIATDTDNGLIVPVIVEADRKNLWSLASSIKDLAERGRAGKLSLPELKGSTISITNIGSAGGMFFTPVINFPEVAILGTGRITEKAIVSDGQIIAAHMMALSLSFDHRIIDGAVAQKFLNEIKRLLADPEQFLMEV
ncbi:2-oxo acid dehydrogenase subunit E2 [Paenibacillus psychroresistens]|uniref:Dihydrolipoamide acetyltransferase component of pyruvate dehydrogenase complex n=1 Tax=Paenibacillus psychroresistens TaxID=1778678 RepID=A0A6B8RKB5_9BACL|nr:dihydrolipoamide acetyltransferase family protein [Paenibacillus psychroresistens]QGQ95993.1 2-oxo acid dehydrogenase subunit E2 [Paenibacillus psychroresistens]